MRIYLILFVITFLSSCTQKITVPVKILNYSLEKNNSTLIIFLRGIGNDIHYFDEHGWVTLIQERYPQYSIAVPDLHIGYIKEGIYFDRLYNDVIKPAKRRGVKYIWLVGVSLGGFGAIMTSESTRKDIDRLYLIAPYLGKGKTLDDIKKSGSSAQWKGRFENYGSTTYLLWAYLKELTSKQNRFIPVYLGYGEKDSMQGLNYLANGMPKNNIIIEPGGHRDGVFYAVFEAMLNKDFFE